MTITCVVVGEGSTEVYIQSLATVLAKRQNPNLKLEFKPGAGIHLNNPPGKLAFKVKNAVDLYNPDLILVHRDSDSNDAREIQARFGEVERAWEGISVKQRVPVVPVRETEAWMLADKEAILEVVGLDSLPLAARKIYPKWPEAVQAKECLHEVFRECRLAAGWKPNRIDTNKEHRQIRAVVKDLIGLGALPSFQKFKRDLQNALNSLTA